MKTIGLIGGMSWESSMDYYRLINEYTKEILGETHSCQSIMYSFDFDYVEKLQRKGDWDALTEEMVKQAKKLKKAGADFIVICANTMHMMAEAIEKQCGIKVLHIADATSKEIVKKGLKTVALLGTDFTMTGDFYKKIFIDNYNINIVIPNEADRKTVHNIIYKELILGHVKPESKQKYQDIIAKLIENGAEGVVLGCTEIPALIKEGEAPIPVFDTTSIHARAAVEYANE